MRSKPILAAVELLALMGLAAMKAAIPTANPPGFDVDKMKFVNAIGDGVSDPSIPPSWKLISVTPNGRIQVAVDSGC